MSNRVISLAILLALPVVSLALPAQRGGNQKVIKDPAEYNAYITALNTFDPEQKAAAMEAFTRAYPNSVVYVDALEQAMAAHQQAGNNAMVLETARHILLVYPHNVRAQAVAVALDRALATSGDSGSQNARAEGCPLAQTGLQDLPRWQKPDNMTEADFEKLRRQMENIFSGAAGFCALQNKNYADARTYYEKAIQFDHNDLQNVYQLSVTELETNPIEPNGFWYCAKAISLAQRQSNTQAVDGMVAYCKAKYKRYHGSENGWDRLLVASANESLPPANPLVRPEPTPCELAVQAVQQNDPGGLSFSDWEFVLSKANCSSANRDAADKVWKAIQDKQRGSSAGLTIPMKVISATTVTISAAITDDNKQANKADLYIALEKPLSKPPAPGTTANVVGLLMSYTADPFMFSMTKGQIPGIQPVVHRQLSAADIEKLLQGGVTPKRTTELVKQKGVDFTLDGATEARLRNAGATDELLLAIATSKKP